MDGAEELPANVSRGEQEIPVPVRGDVRVGVQRQAGNATVPVGRPRREISHHLTYMSQKFYAVEHRTTNIDKAFSK